MQIAGQEVAHIRQEAKIKPFKCVLGPIQILKPGLVSSQDPHIVLILEDSPLNASLPLELRHIPLQGLSQGCILAGGVDVGLGRHHEAFVLEQHHQGHSEPALVAGHLQNVAGILELPLRPPPLLRSDHCNALLEVLHLPQFKAEDL